MRFVFSIGLGYVFDRFRNIFQSFQGILVSLPPLKLNYMYSSIFDILSRPALEISVRALKLVFRHPMFRSPAAAAGGSGGAEAPRGRPPPPRRRPAAARPPPENPGTGMLTVQDPPSGFVWWVGNKPGPRQPQAPCNPFAASGAIMQPTVRTRSHPTHPSHTKIARLQDCMLHGRAILIALLEVCKIVMLRLPY